MVDDFSKHDDKILFAKRIDMLEDSEFRDGLKSKESSEFQLGKVDQI